MRNGNSNKTILDRYLDHEGRVKIWPSKRTKQQMIAGYMTRGFTPGVRYTEKQVNAIIDELHTFGDYAILRRTLCDEGLLERSPDGSAYWLTGKGKTEREAVLALPDIV